MFSYSPKVYQERPLRLVRKVYLHMSKMTVYESHHRTVLPCPTAAPKIQFSISHRINSLILCSFALNPLHKLSLQPGQNRSNLPALNAEFWKKNADLQSHYILGAQKKRLIETGLLSTHNMRGHMFWLKIINGNIPIFFYVSKIKALQLYHLL